MNEKDYIQQIATLSGLQYFPAKGPWGRKSGSAIGQRDGYITVIGFKQTGRATVLGILLRFKEIAQPELLKAALADSPNLPKKQGKLADSGNNFVRWEWKYSLSKPKAEEVVKLVDALREALRPVAQAFDGRCEYCNSTSASSLTLIDNVPGYICSGCQEKDRQQKDQAAMEYERIEPNYPNGLGLGIVAAVAGGIAWGGIAYAINYIFLYGAILIGYLVSLAVIKGTRKVTRFGQIAVPILTIASVLFGDAIFFTLAVMRSEKIPFTWKLLQEVLVHLWEIEMKGNGVLTLIFALVGAGYALYAARKPKFKTSFEPLGAPAPR
jgi:hypothetical protein